MDDHRRRFLLDYDQRGLCPMVESAGSSPVLMVPLPEGMYDNRWAADAEELLRRAREDCPPGAELCALLPAGGLLMEPYGELPFSEGVDHYAAAAGLAARCGADSVLIYRARTLLQARAGVLGSRSSRLPVYVVMEVTGEGEGLGGGGDILSAFVTLQELGIAAFGFYSSVAGILMEPLEAAAPCRHVPLIALTRDLTGALQSAETRELFQSRTASLAARGAQWQGILESGEEAESAVRTLLAAPPCPVEIIDYRAEEEIWAAGEQQVFYLDANLEFSEPISCESDMADEILRLEREGEETICIQLETADDGYSISQNNANLTMLPVAFCTDSEEALESALFYYNGRAIVDGRSLIPEERLREIAERYGAIIV